MKPPKLIVRPYRHSLKYKFVVDLRAYGKGRMFFKTKAEADAEAMRQKTMLERHSREAVGMSSRDLSEIIHARKTLSGYGKTITDATEFYVDHLERVLRCKTTVADLVAELLHAKRKDGASEIYLRDLRNMLAIFSRDFGQRSIASITTEELDNWLRAAPRLTQDAHKLPSTHWRFVFVRNKAPDARQQPNLVHGEAQASRHSARDLHC